MGDRKASDGTERADSISADSPHVDANTLVTEHSVLIRLAISRVAGARASEIHEDVVQRVTTALWKRIRHGRPIKHPRSYLYRCVIRETVRELDRLGDATSELVDDLLVDSEPDPESRLRGRELADAVAHCLDELATERAVAVRAHLADCAIDEIMELHAWPYHKARNLVQRGIRELRARLIHLGFGTARARTTQLRSREQNIGRRRSIRATKQ
jgi:RNA polymerase sigma factor (sigma-70 family)